MKLKNKKIVFGLTSPFYAFKATINEMKKIVSEGGEVFPIIAKEKYDIDSKFNDTKDYISKIEYITNKKVLESREEIQKLENDIMIIAPCSRNYYRKTCFINL